MSRDVVYKLCLETNDSTLFLANIKLSNIDYSIYVEFQDSFKTELHIHTTGVVRIKNNAQIIETIQVVDPLLVSGLLPIATYSLEDLPVLPVATGINPDEILLIPKEITLGISRLAFALSRKPMVIPNAYSVAVGLLEILTVNIAALSNPLPSTIYEEGIHPLLGLTKINRSSKPIDQAQRFIENNKLLRDAMNLRSPALSPQEVYLPPLMLRMPNSLGVWEMIFDVPMRDVPEFSMRFVDSRYQVEDTQTTKKAFNKVSRKFKVLDTQTNQFIYDNLPPFDLILDAEL
jgi:hypothetical protein